MRRGSLGGKGCGEGFADGWKLCSERGRKGGLEMEICLSEGEMMPVDASALGLSHDCL
jgi:hypothetical protein